MGSGALSGGNLLSQHMQTITRSLTRLGCGIEQSGPVVFLTGVINISGTASRTCTIPAGTPLFFPILNFENDNFLCLDPDTNFAVDELRANAKVIIDGATNLACEVDGVSIQNLQRYRVVSPVFDITLPEDNVLQAVGCADALPGIYSPAVSDGFWLMLAPLPVGEHTIHFHGELPDLGFSLGITYNLTVAPGKR